MPADKPPKPTDAELDILITLWIQGPATVRDVYGAINSHRSVEYSTILKFLQIMTEKGLVRVDRSKRAHVYTAAYPRETTQRLLARDLFQRVFNGSAKALVMGALSAQEATEKELAEIRKLLDQYEEEGH